MADKAKAMKIVMKAPEKISSAHPGLDVDALAAQEVLGKEIVKHGGRPRMVVDKVDTPGMSSIHIADVPPFTRKRPAALSLMDKAMEDDEGACVVTLTKDGTEVEYFDKGEKREAGKGRWKVDGKDNRSESEKKSNVKEDPMALALTRAALELKRRKDGGTPAPDGAPDTGS